MPIRSVLGIGRVIGIKAAVGEVVAGAGIGAEGVALAPKISMGGRRKGTWAGENGGASRFIPHVLQD
jgi:hypothetical protein